MINGIINNLIKLLGDVLGFVTALLPNSPFQLLDNSPISQYLTGINYFVPVAQILSILEAWGTAIGAYYLYQAVLRWIKAEN